VNAMKSSEIVTLTTDFGEGSSYVAQVKGVMLSLYPSARIVDISHSVAPQSVTEAAFLLRGFYHYYSPGTVHLVVVDPGVGTERACLAARAGDWFFLAPDNGVLSYVLQREKPIEIVALTDTRFWRDCVCRTFHGRDIFAPVAAHLLRGVPLRELGEPLPELPALLPPLQARHASAARVVGRIVHIDPFGNLISSISPAELAGLSTDTGRLRVQVRRTTIAGLHRTYGERRPGDLIALISSFDLLEVAQVQGNAAAVLNASVGDEITVEKSDGE
jgi:S-adenosyl-L-methionine hydrolase (adenosine-forming)